MLQTGNIEAVVLAAGLSRRMGKRNKLLLPIDGKPMLGHTIDALRQAGLERITVVTGHEAADLERCAASSFVRCIRNPDYRSGMGSSLALGAREAGDAEGLLLCLGDLPFLDSATVVELAQAFCDGGKDRAVVPIFQGRRGHPVIFPRRLFASLERLSGDRGARSILKAEGETLLEVAVASSGVIRDVDTADQMP